MRISLRPGFKANLTGRVLAGFSNQDCLALSMKSFAFYLICPSHDFIFAFFFISCWNFVNRLKFDHEIEKKSLWFRIYLTLNENQSPPMPHSCISQFHRRPKLNAISNYADNYCFRFLYNP